MIETLKELRIYIKNPVLEKDKNKSFFYRFNKLIILVFISLITSLLISFLTSFLEVFNLIDSGKHSIEELLKNESISALHIIFFTVIFAPIIEELIFRAPLVLFKNPSYFRYAYYSSAVLFGYLHISNYQDINSSIILFSPILIGPQIVIGLYLGFIRIKFGLQWSIALHATFNGILVSLFLLAKDALTQT